MGRDGEGLGRAGWIERWTEKQKADPPIKTGKEFEHLAMETKHPVIVIEMLYLKIYFLIFINFKILDLEQARI